MSALPVGSRVELCCAEDKRSRWHPAILREEQKSPFDSISTQFPQMRNSADGPWRWVGARRVLAGLVPMGGRWSLHRQALPLPKLLHAPSPPRLCRPRAISLLAWEDD